MATNRPDVVLCDIGLPGMDGYAVAKALRAKVDPKIQLVAVSGYAQPKGVQKAVEEEFDAHVAKPPDPAKIERLLRRRSWRLGRHVQTVVVHHLA